MKMTSSQLVTLVAAIVCSAAVVYAQTSPSTAAATDPATETATQPPSTPTTGARPPVTTTQPPAAEASTAAPPMGMSTAMPDSGTDATMMMMTSDDHDDNDTDGDDDDGDMDGDKKGDKDGHGDDDDDGGLNNGQIALAVLATLLILGAVGTFAGLCYWKYKGTSYVTVTSDTTYRQ